MSVRALFFTMTWTGLVHRYWEIYKSTVNTIIIWNALQWPAPHHQVFGLFMFFASSSQMHANVLPHLVTFLAFPHLWHHHPKCTPTCCPTSRFCLFSSLMICSLLQLCSPLDIIRGTKQVSKWNIQPGKVDTETMSRPHPHRAACKTRQKRMDPKTRRPRKGLLGGTYLVFWSPH